MLARPGHRIVLAALLLLSLHAAAAEKGGELDTPIDFTALVKGGEVAPIWRRDGARFVYASGIGQDRRFVAVDCASGRREPFFDRERLRAALLRQRIDIQGPPFETFSFVDGERKVRFEIGNRRFDLSLSDYTLRELPAEEIVRLERLQPRALATRFPVGGRSSEAPSPRANLLLRVQNDNLWLRDVADDRLRPLTDDGVDRNGWIDEPQLFSAAVWAADGNTVAAFRMDSRRAHYMPVVHWLKRQEEISYHLYAPAGGSLPHMQLYLIDVSSGARAPVDMGADDAYFRSLGWHANQREFLLFWLSRNGKRLELRAAHRESGRARVLWAEDRPQTFVVSTMNFRNMEDPRPVFKMLSDGRFIIASERSGWNQLYLYGASDDSPARLLAQLTRGDFPVRNIVEVDEKRGWVYFTAHSDPQRLYDTHLMRVSLNGGKLSRLTEATGEHRIQLAPSGEYFLDTHSTVERPPVTELRRADGKRIAVLEKADIGELVRLGWQPPEEFVVKAADGTTDLYGILRRPFNFDRSKKYPVVEYIYAGPQSNAVPRTFVATGFGDMMLFPDAMQRGFITFVVDARGTPERSKAFQDVVYGNWGRNEIADHAAALRAVARTRPYMDLSRVGVFGHSYGGYYATRAMLQAPDLYKVGVASAPAAQLDTIFARASENYLGGRPQDVPEAYEYASNLRLIDRLQGRLLIIHPTSDVNAPFAHTMQLIEALIRAGKRYDLNVFPEGNHSYLYADSGREHVFWSSTIRDYFLEHLF